MFNDFSMLEKATEELLDIFKDILKDTFGESIRYFDKRYKKI